MSRSIAITFARPNLNLSQRAILSLNLGLRHVRCHSAFASPRASIAARSPAVTTPVADEPSYMRNISTWSLLRTIILSNFLTRPTIFRHGMSIMKAVANSKSPLLNPDRNFFIKSIIKPLIYDQFCAGTDPKEVKTTIEGIRNLGFTGVALTYAEEIQLDKSNSLLGTQSTREAQVSKWRAGNLQSLDMVGNDDWLAIKMTGAGQKVLEALLRGEEPPPDFTAAMEAICQKARAQNCRIWIDAEQQAVQPTIDRWTISLMRKHNRGPRPLIYNTVQAYLKESRAKLQRQLQMAEEEGWICAIKIVRGAYIANDRRDLIHDTKQKTDDCYDGIVHEMMTGTFANLSPKHFSNARILLAGHNSDTIRRALALGQELAAKNRLKTNPEFGQLQGMADDIGCEIIQFGEVAQRKYNSLPVNGRAKECFAPRAYKCLTWGTVQQSMQYLVRRAVENAAAVSRMREGAKAARKELSRRIWA